jgi:transposase
VKARAAEADVKRQAREAALKAVVKQGWPVNAAARRWGVSKTTLHRLGLNGADSATVMPKMGAPTFLAEHVEIMLAERLRRAAEQHVGVAPARIAHYARVIAAYAKIPLGKWTGGRDWRRQFMLRHNLSVHKSGQTTGARTRNFNHKTAAQWYASNGPIIELFSGEEKANVDDTGLNPEEMLGWVRAV